MNKVFAFVLCAVFLACGISYAADDDYILVGGEMQKKSVDMEDKIAVSVQLGTLGAGIEGAVSLGEHFTVRAGAAWFEYDYDSKEDDIDYDMDLTLLNFPILVDYYPAKEDMFKHFRVTAGVIPNQNKVDITSQSTQSAVNYSIGSASYTPAQAGTITGEIENESFAPYLGIGIGNPFAAERDWQVSLDLGIMFMGSPEVTLSSSGGTLSSDATFLANLRKEENNLEGHIDEFEFYPVVNVRISRRF